MLPKRLKNPGEGTIIRSVSDPKNGVWIMTVDNKDLEAYAKGFWRRWRGRAHGMAIKQSQEFETLRDHEGSRVWRDIAQHIEMFTNKTIS